MPIDNTQSRNSTPYTASRSRSRVSGCCFPGECLSDLLCDPRHRRVHRDTEMHDLAAFVVEHDEPELKTATRDNIGIASC